MRKTFIAAVALALAAAAAAPTAPHEPEPAPRAEARKVYAAQALPRLDHAAREIEAAGHDTAAYPSAEAAVAAVHADWRRMTRAVGRDWREARVDFAQSWQRLRQKMGELVASARE